MVKPLLVEALGKMYQRLGSRILIVRQKTVRWTAFGVSKPI
jgi:hypothetical protein